MYEKKNPLELSIEHKSQDDQLSAKYNYISGAENKYLQRNTNPFIQQRTRGREYANFECEFNTLRMAFESQRNKCVAQLRVSISTERTHPFGYMLVHFSHKAECGVD